MAMLTWFFFNRTPYRFLYISNLLFLPVTRIPMYLKNKENKWGVNYGGSKNILLYAVFYCFQILFRYFLYYIWYLFIVLDQVPGFEQQKKTKKELYNVDVAHKKKWDAEPDIVAPCVQILQDSVWIHVSGNGTRSTL